MTPEQTAALVAQAREMCAKVPPEPWEIGGPFPDTSVCVADSTKDDLSIGYRHYDPICFVGKTVDPAVSSHPIATFVAYARTAIPELAAALEQVQAELDRVKRYEEAHADRAEELAIQCNFERDSYKKLIAGYEESLQQAGSRALRFEAERDEARQALRDASELLATLAAAR